MSKTTVPVSAATPLIFQDKLFHAAGPLKHCRIPQKRLCVKELSVSTVVQDGECIERAKHLSQKEEVCNGEFLLYSYQLN